MDYPYKILDVFTNRPFGGNPLAVIPDATGLSSDAMQAIAAEFNLSETTFVLPAEDASASHKVRIFTPKAELEFAGHPTIGTAIALAQAAGTETCDFAFEEGVSVVPVTVRPDVSGVLAAELSVAQLPQKLAGMVDADLWLDMLGLNESVTDKNDLSIEVWSCGAVFTFVHVSSLDSLSAAFIDAGTWRRNLGDDPSAGVFVFTTETGSENVDVRARMFAPAHGIAEDPATGSAVAALAGWLLANTDVAAGTHRYTIDQGVEMGRPSRLVMTLAVKDPGEIQAVRVGGCAVPVARGTIDVPEGL